MTMQFTSDKMKFILLVELNNNMMMTINVNEC